MNIVAIQDMTEINRLKRMISSLAIGSIRRELTRDLRSPLAELIRTDPEACFLVDYYLFLFEPEIGGALINDPAIGDEVLVELFSCRIVAAFRETHARREQPGAGSRWFGGYWRLLNTRRRARLIDWLVHDTTQNDSPALELALHCETQELRNMLQSGWISGARLLRLYLSAGDGVFDLIARQIDLYDFLQILAQEVGDQDFLEELKQYFHTIVHLRIATDFIEECSALAGADGKIPLNRLVTLVPYIPEESQEYTMHLLETRGLIEGETLRSVLKLA